MNPAPPPPYATDKPVNYYQAPPSQAPPSVAIVQPVYVGAPVTIMGDYPMQCTCSHCGRQIVTRTEKKSGLLAWLICGGIVLVGGWLGCCFIPFCIDGCKDTEHYCPNCSALLGVNKKL